MNDHSQEISSNELTLVNTADNVILSIENKQGEEKDLILALKYSPISVWGVIGYPKYASHPALIAACAIA